MKEVALIFPGQGSQSVGMGKELYDFSQEAKEVFEAADKIIDGLSGIIFNGPEEKLTQTAYCQPAIFTVSIAALKFFQADEKYKSIKPVYTCGHSLGEFSALVACGALDFESGLKLVKKRAQFMDEATQKAEGAMSAIIGAEESLIREVCNETGAQVANYNSPDQIVITGEKQKVAKAGEVLQEKGAKRVVPLPVSGAFHSSLMASAAENFKAAVDEVQFSELNFPVLGNVDAEPTRDINRIKNNLPKQIVSSVQWVKSIRAIEATGITDYIEIGPGNVLKGLLRKISKDLTVSNIRTPEDLANLVI